MSESKPQPTMILKIGKYLPAAEKICLVGLAIGLALFKQSIDSNVVFLSLNGLAVIYFLTAYVPLEVLRDENEPYGFSELLAYTILPKVIWISAAVSLMGIMFYLLELEGYANMLLIGSTASGVALIVIGAFFATGVKHLKVHVPMLYRVIPILIVDLYLLMW